MAFGQLKEYNMRNIFLEKLYAKCEGETISSSLTQFVFIVCQIEGYRNILKLSWRPLAITSFRSF